MQLHVCHLYPDLLNTYGDLGNLQIMRRRLSARGIDMVCHNVSLNDPFSDYDLIFLGGGQDFEQTIVAEDLQKRGKSFLSDHVESGGAMLCVCGGYQLMGEYYCAPDGTKLEGLSILPIHTDADKKRLIGNIIIQNGDKLYFGFENHSGRTYTGTLAPLGTVLYGNGNNGADKTEGAVYKNTYCTYLHGPLFSKNPELCDEIIKKALLKRYGEVELAPLDDRLEESARKILLTRLLPSYGVK